MIAEHIFLLQRDHQNLLLIVQYDNTIHIRMTIKAVTSFFMADSELPVLHHIRLSWFTFDSDI